MEKSKKELATADSFVAFQVNNIVVLIAQGKNNTSGYRVFFESSLVSVFPPEFVLLQSAPTGPIMDTITPFVATTSFQKDEAIKKISVNDKKKKHVINVIKI